MEGHAKHPNEVVNQLEMKQNVFATPMRRETHRICYYDGSCILPDAIPSTYLTKVTVAVLLAILAVVQVVSTRNYSYTVATHQHHAFSVSRGNESFVSTATANKTCSPTLKFVFLVGIEGTGHHLFTSIFIESPYIKRQYELGLRETVREVQTLMFGNGGLMTMHCLYGSSKYYRIPSDSPVRKCPSANSICLHQRIVRGLRKIASVVGDEALVIPINANGNEGSMASYPNQRHPCRTLEFPNLDFFYDACNEAGVECGHVYLYRDPFDVIRSTTVTRQFNEDLGQAMQLYTTMLHVIFAQFAARSTSTYGCVGFYDSQSSWEDRFGLLRDISGWTDNDAFRKFINRIYRRPTQVGDTNKTSIIPEKYEKYMRSMYRIHEDVLQLCLSSARASSKVATTPC